MIALHYITVSEDDNTVVEKFYEQLQEIEEVKQIFDNIDSNDTESVSATG